MNYRQQRSLPYKPGQRTPYKLSRSKIELFMQCPRCFWLETRLKISRPSSPPFNINKAIDKLFKREFDVYRQKGEPHPLMTKHRVEAIPYKHADLDTWRENFTGVYHLHQPTNLHIFGAVDDVWVDRQGRLLVVDYKATAKDKPIKALGPPGGWQDMYRRQMEIYQWLLKQNGFDVHETGYFVYATGVTDRDGFGDRMEFETYVFPHHGSTDWVEDTLHRMKQTMESNEMPPVGQAAMGGSCEHCAYARARTELTLQALNGQKKT